jgi:hypothetical protein
LCFRLHQLTSLFVSINWLLFSFPSTDFCFRFHQLTSVFAPINWLLFSPPSTFMWIFYILVLICTISILNTSYWVSNDESRWTMLSSKSRLLSLCNVPVLKNVSLFISKLRKYL